MDFEQDLESKSSPKIRKAAASIAKHRVFGYEELLKDALASQIQKPRSWQTQSQLIKAIGIIGSDYSVPYLEQLAASNFDTSILYKDLGFSICRLKDLLHSNLGYLKSTFSSSNSMLISGSCSALLYESYIPSESDMLEIFEAVKAIDFNEGQVITPRCYIADLAYLWPVGVTRPFLELCAQSKWDGLVEIATSSLKGEKSNYVLV